MEMLGGVMLILALPIMAIAGFFMAIGARTRLRQLEIRMLALERGVRAAAAEAVCGAVRR